MIKIYTFKLTVDRHSPIDSTIYRCIAKYNEKILVIEISFEFYKKHLFLNMNALFNGEWKTTFTKRNTDSSNKSCHD